MMLEPNAQVYNGATKTAQAQILVNMAINLVKSNPELAEHFKIYKKYLEFNGSIFNTVSSNAISQDGINPSCIIIDESMVVARGLKDSLTSGFLMRKNYQTFMISTEYPMNDKTGWFDEMLDYGKLVLEDVLEDERILPIMYCLDDAEEIHNQEMWLKACPILEEVPASSLEDEYKQALENPSIMSKILVRNYNVPQTVNEENSYLMMDKWKTNAVDKINFEGKEVHIGVDLSLTTDISAVSMMYKEDGKYYVKSVGFIPEDSLSKRREKFDYRLSASKGELFIREGMIVDYDFIEDYIRNIEKEYKCKIKTINFDPYNAVNMMLSLSNDYEVVEIRQSMTNLSSPTKEFRNEVYLGNVIYEKSMLFDWCVSNAITRIDKSENEMLDKSKSKNRIDLLVASIFAFKSEKFDYRLSASKGELFIREGMIVDYDFIEDYIRNIEEEYKCKIKTINFDPYNAVNMMLSLSNDYDVVEIRQSMTNLSSPTKEFRNEVYLGNVIYEKSMLFDWCVSNAITRIDKSENEMLDKSKSKNRIDLLVASIFAFKSAYEVEEKAKFNIDDIFII